MTFVSISLDHPVRVTIRDYRCPNCGRLLFRGHVPQTPGLTIEIRCSRCNHMTVFPEPEKEKSNEPTTSEHPI